MHAAFDCLRRLYRTALAGIKASAESLQQPDVVWNDEDRDGFTSAIVRESDRLNRLVGNLLDMSRIEGGARWLQRDWYDAGELIREVASRLGSLLRGRTVALEIPDGLPPMPVDYLMVDQGVTNLLENAVKDTPAGSPLDVRVKRAARQRARLDRGSRAGHPRDEARHLFRQVRAASTARADSRVRAGTGRLQGHCGRTRWTHLD